MWKILQTYYLYHLINFKKGEVYNVSDDKPASSEDVMQYGAKILNLPEPKNKARSN